MAGEHPRELMQAGVRALQARDPRTAQDLLQRAAQAAPQDAEIRNHLGHALRMQGDLAGALASFEAALAIDPYHFPALLSKGSALEKLGKPKLAAKAFKDALKIAPPDSELPEQWRAAVAHAREVIVQNSAALADFLSTRTADVRAQFGKADLSRFDEALNILAGRQRAFVQEPALLLFPRLPPIPFHDRAHFPWMAELEAATDMIREELVRVQPEADKFAPYIQFPAGVPVNQWEALNYSPDWSVFYLWRDGKRIDENIARCPKTAALLEKMPMAQQPGYAPTAMFSVLQPHTTIPAHTGSANTRLVCHLPLILPDGCRFRVGNDVRPWRMNEAWVFDDTIEHEAWNDSDHVRVVLIFDVWNPLLTEAERALVCEMMTAYGDYTRSER